MRMLTGIVAILFCTGGFAQAQPVPSLSDNVRAFVQTDSPVVALTHVQVVDGTGALVGGDVLLHLGGEARQLLVLSTCYT